MCNAKATHLIETDHRFSLSELMGRGPVCFLACLFCVQKITPGYLMWLLWHAGCCGLYLLYMLPMKDESWHMSLVLTNECYLSKQQVESNGKEIKKNSCQFDKGAGPLVCSLLIWDFFQTDSFICQSVRLKLRLGMQR